MPQFKCGVLILKVVLSIWGLYQIAVMLIMPNLSSYLGRSTQNFVSSYASMVGLNASWNFFSPDPAHTMYIRYLISFGEESDREPVEGTFPVEGKRGVRDLIRQRELYVMRYMVIDPRKLQYLMGPWFCRQYPGAQSVDMEHVVETVAPLQEAVTFHEERVESLSKQLQVTRVQYSCDGNVDEVEL